MIGATIAGCTVVSGSIKLPPAAAPCGFAEKNRFRVIAMHYRGILALFHHQERILRRARFAPHR